MSTARSFTLTNLEQAGRLMADIARDETLLAAIERAASLCADAIRGGGKVMFAGNGGSAADAQHLSAELVGRLGYERPGMPAISLATDVSALTAIGNDYGYDQVFSRQVDAVGKRGDALICISTSGKSPNLMTALAAARAKGIATIGLTGASGGTMVDVCDLCLRVPSTDTQKIQEAQIVIGHIVCGLIQDVLHPRTS